MYIHIWILLIHKRNHFHVNQEILPNQIRMLETTLAEQKEHLGSHFQFRFWYYLSHMTLGKPITNCFWTPFSC